MIIIIAAIQAGFFQSAIVAVIGSVLTLGYFLKVQRYGFHGEKEINEVSHVPSFGMRTAMVVLAILCVCSSVLIIPGIKEVVFDPVIDTIINKTEYIQLVLGR